jgi:hypothetical protein
MKKLLLILLCVPLLFTTCKKEGEEPTNTNNNNNSGPKTYIPDDNFEQSLINFGYDNVLDDSVFTSAIDTVTTLFLGGNPKIFDFTGIEDFIALIEFDCHSNQLTSLDVSQNTALEHLWCWNNQLTSLNVSQNIALITLNCWDNPISNLDVSNNTVLEDLSLLDCNLYFLDVSNNTALTLLYVSRNNLSSLDVSNNTALTHLGCDGNTPLSYLDVRNGNNMNMPTFTSFVTVNTPNLSCINVDDANWSTSNWTYIDPQHYFSEDCNAK